MAVTAPAIAVAVDGGVATLTLARPDTGNAIDPVLARELREAAEGLAARDDVRAVLLRAEGKMFCVGGDVGFFASAPDRHAALHALAGDLHDGIRALVALDVPIVAAVQGAAAGAGMSLACAADVVIAGPAASFTVAYTAVGLSPDGGQSWTLPRLVGVRRAADMMLRNTRVKADEALRIGLVTEVVAQDALLERTTTVAHELAAGPTGALAATRRLLRASATATLDEQLDAERESIAVRGATAEAGEGIAAFLQRRPADFPGVGTTG
ncbi:enoyl-CoA hydratase/isomerase family protein [Patulibacter sp.]|uniref:enoyl-CoA hydratase/isomerase family protein n=1 Tax=Patulibacter sp. TaxID=1912859 RepID=UPI002719CB27|nr:enoyl-CoA hydratase-related protein [Patulibacter sp.]MDO9407412.1 enoyl-CoA hydratase-related protein [Patulibacter sp.]